MRLSRGAGDNKAESLYSICMYIQEVFRFGFLKMPLVLIQNSIPASVGIRRSCCLSDVGILTASTSSSFTIALPD